MAETLRGVDRGHNQASLGLESGITLNVPPFQPRIAVAEEAPSSGTEIGEDGEYAPVIVGCECEVKLLEDAVHVRLDRLGAEEELLADALVGAAFGHQAEYLAFACGEFAERPLVAATAEQLADDFRVDRCST